MAHLQYFAYEGFGEKVRKETHYSQVVRIGDTLECSGQGGWDRLTSALPDTFSDQVDQAFANVEHALQQAGGKGWSQVYKVRCYIAPLNMEEDAVHVVRNLRKYCPGHQPLFTGIGVESLAFGMKVEVEVCAHLGGEEGGGK